MRGVLVVTALFSCGGSHELPVPSVDASPDAGPSCADFDLIERAPIGMAVANVFAGDFNGDGFADVYVRSRPGSVVQGHIVSDEVLLNDGHGAVTHVAANVEGVYFDCASMRLGDVDRDGNPDLLCAGGTYNTLEADLGQAAPAWRLREGANWLSPPISDATTWTALPADSFAYSDRAGVHVAMVSEAGRFLGSGATLLGSGSWDSLATADVDGDGSDDLLAHDGSADAVTVMAGSDRSARTSMATHGTIDVADLDGNGTPEVLAFGERLEIQRVTTGQLGTGSFVDLPISPPYLHFIVDANHDGHPDIVLVSQTQVFVLVGDGSGAFAAARELTHSGAPFNFYSERGAAVVDLDHDGNLDLVGTDGTSVDTLRIWRGCPLH